LAQGVQAGDSVGLFMSNCPEMAFVIYALGKIGAVAALLNNTLRSREYSRPPSGGF